MAKSNIVWCFCPSCSEFLLISNRQGIDRAFPLGPKAKTLISALVAEQAANPTFAKQVEGLLAQLRERVGDGEEKLITDIPTTAPKPKRTRKKKT